MRHIRAPDFPTGGIIVGRAGVRGGLPHRPRPGGGARARPQRAAEGRRATRSSSPSCPYQVNKAELIRKMADLANDKVVPEIRDLRDESGRDGVRVVIELRRDAVPMVVLNKLYKHTAVADDLRRQRHRAGRRRAAHAGARATMIRHYLDAPERGRHPALALPARAGRGPGAHPRGAAGGAGAPRRGHRADPRRGRPRRGPRRPDDAASTSPSSRRARSSTCACSASPSSRPARSRRSTASCRSASPSCGRSWATRRRVYALIREELLEIRGRYADERRTEIVPGEGDIDLEDLIAEEEMVISISHGRLRQAPAGLDLPRPGPRRQGPARGAAEGRGLHRAPLHRLDPPLPALLHQHRQGLPPEGPRAAPGRARLARPPHRERPRAARGRGGAGGLRHARLQRGQVPGARDARRHGQEDRAAQLRHHPARGRPDRDPAHRTTTSWWASSSPTATRTCWSCRPAARPPASTRGRSARWAATRAACAAMTSTRATGCSRSPWPATTRTCWS